MFDGYTERIAAELRGDPESVFDADTQFTCACGATFTSLGPFRDHEEFEEHGRYNKRLRSANDTAEKILQNEALDKLFGNYVVTWHGTCPHWPSRHGPLTIKSSLPEEKTPFFWPEFKTATLYKDQ